MQTKFYIFVGYGTLLCDAYLVLTSIAAKMMQPQYGHLLPPFGWEGVGVPSHFTVLFIATWTGILAMGCLARNTTPEKADAPGKLWFVLVLATVWLVHLIPLLRDLFIGVAVWAN